MIYQEGNEPYLQKLPMRIAFVHHGPEYGGVEKHLIDLIERLDPRRFDIVILCFGRYGFGDAFSRERESVRVITGLKRTHFMDYLKNFRETRPDLIVFESGSVGDFPWYGHAAAKFCGARSAFDYEHGMPPGFPQVRVRGLRSLLRRLFGWRTLHGLSRWLAWRLSDKVVTVSEALRRALIADYGCPERKTLTIWNGADLDHFSPSGEKSADLRKRLGVRADECVLLAVARLTAHKRIGLIFDAMEILRREGQPVRCLIAGAGPQERELRERCEQLGLSRLVEFLGHQEDVRPCYAAADVFILPSESEGLSISLIEAMSSGLPSITTASGGPVELIAHGSEGWLVNSFEELTAAIRYAVTHAEERRQMGLRARQKALRHFSIESCTKKITELLLSAAAERRELAAERRRPTGT